MELHEGGWAYRKEFLRTLLSTFTAIWSSCAGELEHPEHFDPEAHYCASSIDVPSFFVERCGSSNCHGHPIASCNAGGLDLVSEGWIERLANVPAGSDESTVINAACSAKSYVVPGDPDSSFLYEKIAAEDPECGLRMPLDPSYEPVPLSVQETNCVYQWIAQLDPNLFESDLPAGDVPEASEDCAVETP